MANRKFYYQNNEAGPDRREGAQSFGSNKDRRSTKPETVSTENAQGAGRTENAEARRERFNRGRGRDSQGGGARPDERTQSPAVSDGVSAPVNAELRERPARREDIQRNGNKERRNADGIRGSADGRAPENSDRSVGADKRENSVSGRNANDRRGNYPSKRPQDRARGERNNFVRAEAPRYDASMLDKEVSSLGLSVKTGELLEKNRFRRLGDLVSRSEKDMFRIQGFGKKNLLEIKDALGREGMSFKPEAGRNPQQPQQRRDDPRANSRTNLNAGRAKKAAPAPPPKKLTEPLPVDEWRKIQKNGKWGFFDGFKTVIPTDYDEVFCFKDGLASVEKEEKCGYIDSENNVVIPFEYETAMSFSEGLASVVKGGKCGYINKNNEIIIPFEFDAATAFEDGEAKIKKDGKWGSITQDGSIRWI